MNPSIYIIVLGSNRLPSFRLCLPAQVADWPTGAQAHVEVSTAHLYETASLTLLLPNKEGVLTVAPPFVAQISVSQRYMSSLASLPADLGAPIKVKQLDVLGYLLRPFGSGI